MKFSEQPPSVQWAALKYGGEKIAQVWLKPDGDPLALTFRLPPGSFQIPGLGQRLTPESLLKSVGIAAEEVETFRHEGAAPIGRNGADADLRQPLPPPAPDVSHLVLHVRLKPPVRPDAPAANGGPEVSEGTWQELEARWKAILDVEASMETLRISMESLQAEMESSSRRMLTTDEKVNALNADVAQWNKAKTRVLHALPKVKEYIHRATWVAGTPERKKLEEIFKQHIQPRVPFPAMDKVVEQFDNLLKDRQVLAALGNSVCQEGKSISADLQGTLRTLQSNASSNANRKRAATSAKGKFV